MRHWSLAALSTEGNTLTDIALLSRIEKNLRAAVTVIVVLMTVTTVTMNDDNHGNHYDDDDCNDDDDNHADNHDSNRHYHALPAWQVGSPPGSSAGVSGS